MDAGPAMSHRQQQPPQPSLMTHFTQPFLAGWVSGAAGIALGHPLDTVKTLQQVQQVARQGGRKSIKSRKHMLRVVRDIYVENGVRGFFRGLLYPLATSGVINAAFFGATDLSRRLLQEERQQNVTSSSNSVEHRQHGDSVSHYGRVYAAGCAGGMAQLPFVVPAEVVKVQLQAQLQRGHLPEGIGGSLRHSVLIMRQQGVRGLYRGAAITSVRDVPTYGVYMVSFEFIKDRLDTALGTQDGTAAELVGGGCAGVISWTLATPADVVKSRVQAATTADGHHPREGGGAWQAAVGVYREAGFAGFFRGWSAIVVRAFVTNAVTFVMYMNLLRWSSSATAAKAADELT